MIATMWQTAVDLVWPRQCQICGNTSECDSYPFLCKSCYGQAAHLSGPSCQICGLPFRGVVDSLASCPNCKEMQVHFDRAIAVMRFCGPVRYAIHELKYSGRIHWSRPMLKWFMQGDEREIQNVDIIIPVPLHAVRERERGFNQARLLADGIGRARGLAVSGRALVRVRSTETQTHLNRRERLKNLLGAFRVEHPFDVEGRKILLVDDVLTTGSTASECARVLKEAGATSVLVFTLARG